LHSFRGACRTLASLLIAADWPAGEIITGANPQKETLNELIFISIPSLFIKSEIPFSDRLCEKSFEIEHRFCGK